MKHITIKAFQEAKPRTAEDVAKMLGLDLSAPEGQHLIGWMWIYGDGAWTLFKRRQGIGHIAGPPMDLVPMFVTLPESLTRVAFFCPVCGFISHHRGDVQEGYCATCKDWTRSRG